MKLDKVTVRADTETKRLYDDACGTALALEFVGERWSLLIMRELVYGPRRFGEIRDNLPGISANVLTQRLEKLESAGVLRRRRLHSPANARVYELTEWGLETAPVMRALGRWAARSPMHDPMLFMSASSAIMSLETLVDSGKLAGAEIIVGFDIAGDPFRVRIANGAMTAVRGPVDDADVRFTGDTMALRHTIYGKLPLGAGAGLSLEGDRAAAQRFVDLFRLPEKAAPGQGRG